MSLHLPICPSISSLLYSISGSPSRLLCFPSPLGDLHLALPLCINTEILKFSLQFFRPLFTPPEAEKTKRNEKKNEKCSQWGLEPKLKEWRDVGELGVYKTINKLNRRENKACWHCGASADGPGGQLKHASLACSACASSSLMAKKKKGEKMDKRLYNYWQQDLNIPLNISDLIRAVVVIDQSLISSWFNCENTDFISIF